MQRHHAFATFVLLLIGGLPIGSREASVFCASAAAQDWATKMFSETSHNFGTVVRGAKVEYRFQFHNPYKEAVHVAAVSSSCHCTEPEIAKSTLATYEQSEIIARFNTRAFTGNHSATITVTFDKPYYATAQLNVWGDIRGDIEVKSADSTNESGVVDFGTVDQGETRERKMTVVRYGRSDWQITDVRSVNSSYEVEVVDGTRVNGKVSYELIARLKKDAPPGYIHDPLILVTNDSQVPQFPIEVEGIIKAELTVLPQVLAMGSVEAGQQATKPLVVKGQKPFKIVAVICDDDSFSFKVPPGSGIVRIIPVTFTAPSKPGQVVKKIKIETDMGKSLTLEVLTQATVTPAPAATTGSSDPKTDAAKNPAKESTPPVSSTPTILKLDSADAGAINGAKSSGKTNSGTTTPSVLKPTSVTPNPIRSNATRPAAGSAAAAN